MKRRSWLLLGPIFLLFVSWRWMPRGEAPALGVQQGRLSPCPTSPNAVSSQTDSAQHRVAPLPAQAPPAEAIRRCREACLAEPGAQLVTESGSYLRFEMTTPWWRFIDDLECLHDPATDVIHVRSASRIGHSDLGANRRRVERIRARLERE
jgi:uncharacterized protein (DUF1499 family)